MASTSTRPRIRYVVKLPFRSHHLLLVTQCVGAHDGFVQHALTSSAAQQSTNQVGRNDAFLCSFDDWDDAPYVVKQNTLV